MEQKKLYFCLLLYFVMILLWLYHCSKYLGTDHPVKSLWAVKYFNLSFTLRLTPFKIHRIVYIYFKSVTMWLDWSTELAGKWPNLSYCINYFRSNLILKLLFGQNLDDERITVKLQKNRTGKGKRQSPLLKIIKNDILII